MSAESTIRQELKKCSLEELFQRKDYLEKLISVSRSEIKPEKIMEIEDLRTLLENQIDASAILQEFAIISVHEINEEIIERLRNKLNQEK
jgi:hypothetical protein